MSVADSHKRRLEDIDNDERITTKVAATPHDMWFVNDLVVKILNMLDLASTISSRLVCKRWETTLNKRIRALRFSTTNAQTDTPIRYRSALSKFSAVNCLTITTEKSGDYFTHGRWIQGLVCDFELGIFRKNAAHDAHIRIRGRSENTRGRVTIFAFLPLIIDAHMFGYKSTGIHGRAVLQCNNPPSRFALLQVDRHGRHKWTQEVDNIRYECGTNMIYPVCIGDAKFLDYLCRARGYSLIPGLANILTLVWRKRKYKNDWITDGLYIFLITNSVQELHIDNVMQLAYSTQKSYVEQVDIFISVDIAMRPYAKEKCTEFKNARIRVTDIDATERWTTICKSFQLRECIE